VRHSNGFVVAENLQKATDAKVKAVHVYNVPIQFSIHSKEHLDKKVEIHLKEKYEKFIKKIGYQGFDYRNYRRRENGVAEKMQK
jgi:hypothetical protein